MLEPFRARSLGQRRGELDLLRHGMQWSDYTVRGEMQKKVKDSCTMGYVLFAVYQTCPCSSSLDSPASRQHALHLGSRCRHRQYYILNDISREAIPIIENISSTSAGGTGAITKCARMDTGSTAAARRSTLGPLGGDPGLCACARIGDSLLPIFYGLSMKPATVSSLLCGDSQDRIPSR